MQVLKLDSIRLDSTLNTDDWFAVSGPVRRRYHTMMVIIFLLLKNHPYRKSFGAMIFFDSVYR